MSQQQSTPPPPTPPPPPSSIAQVDKEVSTPPHAPPNTGDDEVSSVAPPTPPPASPDNGDDQKLLSDKRGWLMVVVTLVASLTYQTALSPPGGFWQDTALSSATNRGHVAGTPILHDIYPCWYATFMELNTSVFVLSLVLTMLLYLNEKVSIRVLEMLIALDLFGLMMAYTAGIVLTSRNMEMEKTMIPLFSVCMFVFFLVAVVINVYYFFDLKRQRKEPVPEGRGQGA